MSTVSILQRTKRYALAEACDGRECVDKALADPPDLILLDVVMPRMTGFQACEELRRHPQTEHVPVVLLTTRGEPVNVEQGYLVGCNEYLTKPVNGPELLAKVESLLAG